MKWLLSFILVLWLISGSKLHARDSHRFAPVCSSTPEYKSTTASLRRWIESWSDTNVTLSVNHLKCKDGWAWVETIPHYADGKKHEEKIDVLMRQKEGKWKVVYAADNDDGMSSVERVERDTTLQRFLKPPYGSAPLEIFKHEGEKQ